MSFRSIRTGLILMFAVVTAAVPSFASRTHRGPTSGHWKTSSGKKPKVSKVSKVRGQRQIDPTRAAEIQQALIKQNYLSGEPSGQWDQQTEAAMRKFQADHGWQTKLTPDSRALIKLGLGPNAIAPPEHGTSQSFLSEPDSALPGSERRDSSSGGNAMLGSNSMSQ